MKYKLFSLICSVDKCNAKAVISIFCTDINNSKHYINDSRLWK